MALEELLVIGLSVIVLPPLLEKLHVNIKAGEVITGIVLAALVPGLIAGEWLALLADIGLIVLMFEIGLDIDVEFLKDSLRESALYGAYAFFVPLALVTILLSALGWSLLVSFIVGIGLSSTSLAVVSPIVRGEETGVLKNAVMVSEMLGVTLLVMFVKSHSATKYPLWAESLAILGFILFTILVVPRIVEKLQVLDSKNIIEFETKVILLIVLFIALVSEKLGAHAATGAFLTGLFFAESTHRGMELEDRLEPVIQIFTPLFFLHIGTLIEIEALTLELAGIAVLLSLLVFLSRFLAFGLASKFTGKSYDPGWVSLFAPCITITATAAGIGMETGLIEQEAFSAFMYSGLLLTVLGPMASKKLENLEIP